MIQPGDIKTGFTDAREKSPLGDDIYHGRIALSVAGMEHDEQTGIPASRAAGQIYRISLKKRPKAVYTIGTVYKFFIFLQRILPETLVYQIIGRIYGHTDKK